MSVELHHIFVFLLASEWHALVMELTLAKSHCSGLWYESSLGCTHCKIVSELSMLLALPPPRYSDFLQQRSNLGVYFHFELSLSQSEVSCHLQWVPHFYLSDTTFTLCKTGASYHFLELDLPNFLS